MPRGASLSSALQRVQNSSSAMLQAGYATALLFSTALTLICAVLLATDGFATVTKSLIIAAIAPLVLSWGIPDAVTFSALRGARADDRFSAGIAATTALSSVAMIAVYLYSRTQGLDLTQSLYTSAASACAMLGMSTQGVELALNHMRRVAVFAFAPNALALLTVIVFWATGTLDATNVLLARAGSAVVVAICRLGLLRKTLTGRLRAREVWGLLRLGTPIHVSSVLAAGSLRLEQVLVLQYFPERTLAAYGLVMPAINGIRTLLYGAGTAEAVSLARVGNTSLRTCHRRLSRLALVGVVLTALASGAVAVVAALTGLSDSIPLIAVPLFVLGGTLSGLIDVLVRMYRGSGDAWHGVLARVAGLAITAALGPWLISSGATSASMVGLLAGSGAYLVLVAALMRKGTKA